MTLDLLIQKYGYFAVLLGTMVEGEGTLILASIASHQQYLNLYLVIPLSILGTFIGETFFFLLGRKKGKNFLEKHPKWSKKIPKVEKLTDKYGVSAIFISRFLYGIRSLTPFIIGMGKMKNSTFVILNIISSTIWGIIVGFGGYLFSHTIQVFMNDIKKLQFFIIGFIIFFISGVFGFKYLKKKYFKNKTT